MLGVVYMEGNNLNLSLTMKGYAEVYRGWHAKGFDLDPYWQAGTKAREEGLNIWSQGDKYVSPKEWRKWK